MDKLTTIKEMQHEKLIDELFEEVKSLRLRVNQVEHRLDWQREVALREIGKFGQEQQGHDDTYNPLIERKPAMGTYEDAIREIIESFVEQNGTPVQKMGAISTDDTPELVAKLVEEILIPLVDGVRQ